MLLYGLIVLISLLSAANGGIGLDYTRDVYYASRIAAGIEFPLGGPVFNNTFQLGPVWFYLCAIPLAFGGGYESVAIWIALIGALKLPLAFLAGRALLDTRFGVLLTIAAFISGWTWVPLKFPTHAAVVETTVWLLIFVTARWWRQRTALRAAAVGLASAVCLHAHPSTLPIAAACSLLVLVIALKEKKAMSLAALIAAGLALFLPYLLSTHNAGWSEVASVQRYTEREAHWPSLGHWWQVVKAIYLNGHHYELQYSAGLPSAWVVTASRIYSVLLSLALLTALAIGWRQPGKRAEMRLLLLALAALGLQVVFLVGLRPFTTFWMIFSAMPLAAIGLAVALRLVAAWPLLGRGVAAFLGLLVLATLAESRLYWQRDYSELFLPNNQWDGMFDVKQKPVSGTIHHLAIFRARDVDRVVEISSRYTHIHGQAAVMLDFSFGRLVGYARQTSPTPVLGGGRVDTGARPVAGYTEASFRRTGRQPAFVDAGMAWVVPLEVYAPEAGLRLAQPRSVREFQPDRPTPETTTMQFDFVAPCGADIAITNLLRPYSEVKILAATANAIAASVTAEDNITRFLRAPRCGDGAPVQWHLTVNGPRDAIDVIRF